MSRPEGTGLPPRKKIVTSLLLSVILIGSIISSTTLLGLTIAPQQAWAALPNAPTYPGSAPADNLVTSTNPTFRWSSVSASPAVTSYHLLVDNDADFSTPTIDASITAPTVTFTPSPALPLGTYKWKVAAHNSEGDGLFSTTRTITLALASPALSSPADKSTATDQTPTFSWGSVSGATSYQIQIKLGSDDSPNSVCSPTIKGGFGFSSPVLLDQVVAGTSFTPTTDLPDGKYFWHVRSISGSIVGCYSASQDVTIDDIVSPGVPTLLSPADNGFVNTQTPTFDWSDVTDPSGVDRYVLQYSTTSNFASGTVTTQNIDGSSGNPPAPSTFTPTAAHALTETKWYWRVQARDDAGNTGSFSSTFSFTIDITGPTVTADPTSTAFGPAGTSVELNSDDTDLASIYYTTDGSDPADTNNANRIQYTIAISITTTTTLKFIGYDNFGNAGTPGEETYTLDNTGPTVTADPTSTAFGPAGTSVELNSDDTDLASIYYTTDGSDPADTNNANRIQYTIAISITTTTTLKFIGYDNFGNAGTPGEETYTLDNTGPTVTADPTSTAFGPAGTSVELNSDDTDLASIYYTTDGSDPADTNNANRIQYTIAISITTTTTLKFIGYDNFGNAGTPGEETYTLDNTGPTVTADPTSTAFGPAGTSVELNSDDTDLASIYYTTDGSDPADTNNANRIQYTIAISITTTTTLKFIGYDNFGNAGTPGEETYTLDNTGPTVTADPTSTAFGPAGTSVELNSDDTDLASIYYTTDGSDPADTNNANRIQYTIAISITTTTTLKFIGYDNFGNAGTPGEETYTLDNTGPTVTADPTSTAFGPAGTSVELNSDDTDLASIYYTTDGSDPADTNNANRIQYTIAISITTTTTLKFIGYDNFGNAGTPGEETYTLDNTGPTVTADPTSTAFGPAGTSVELNSDDTDLASIYYTTDGSDPADTNNANRIQYTIAISITTTTTLKFIGYDNFGNAGTPGEETYTLDNTGPTVTATPLGGTFGPAGTSVELNSDDTDLASIYYTTDGSDPADTNNANRIQYTIAISITTTTTLKFIGYDNFGNAGTPGEETYTLDNTGPTVTATPLGGTFGPAGTSVELNSDDTDLASIYYTTDGSDPADTNNANRIQYTIAISITTTTTLKAIGYDTSGNAGPVLTEVYTINSGPVTIDTLMNLKLSANKATPGATFTVSGKLIDAVADSPISGKSITFTIDGTSSGAPVTTNSKGEFSIQLIAPNTLGVHEIQAHFAGDAQYNPSDSPVRQLKVEGAAPADTSLTLKLSKNTVNAGSSYSATGTLVNEITKKPIAGMTISVTGGSTTQTGTTDSKGKYDIQLTAPSTNGIYDIQAHFAGNSQYKSSDSAISKLTVQGDTNLAITTTSASDTSLSLKVEGKDKMTGGATYSVSGKLVDSASKKPISGKEISVTTDGGSPKGSDTTNAKGEYEVKLKAPDSPGKYNIKAHFDGDSQFKSSDSSVKITVEENKLSNQKTTVTTNQPTTAEDQPAEDQPAEGQPAEDQPAEDQPAEDQTN